MGLKPHASCSRAFSPKLDSIYAARAEKTGKNVMTFAPQRFYSPNFSDTKRILIDYVCISSFLLTSIFRRCSDWN